ncbi:MAG: hypothetical protein AAFQ02_08305, partial [Bacteroidota bacterium]
SFILLIPALLLNLNKAKVVFQTWISVINNRITIFGYPTQVGVVPLPGYLLDVQSTSSVQSSRIQHEAYSVHYHIFDDVSRAVRRLPALLSAYGNGAVNPTD